MGDTRRLKQPEILAIVAALAVGFAAPSSASFTSLAPATPIAAPSVASSLTASVETPTPSLGARLSWVRTPPGPRPYFGARYYGAKIGRFTTVDPLLDQQAALLDPQQWNRYAYTRNNPFRYVDPDGRAIETPWDVLNIGLGVASLTANVAAGNVGGAALDAVGLVYDVAATAVPGLPGGAGAAIKASRAARAVDTAHDAAAALIAANRASGKAAEARVAAELFAEGKTILGSQVCCKTSEGRRFIDHLTKDAAGTVTAVEVKSGNATRSAAQRAKDSEIAAGRGTFVGRKARSAGVEGSRQPVETVERKPTN